MNTFGLDTKFVMPAWWAKAFEAVASVPLKVSDPFDLSSQMGLIPALNRPELDALGSLLHKIQVQILQGFETISVRVSDHAKSSPYVSMQQKFAFDRILQLVSATHLAAYGTEGEATTRPLFRGFRIDSHQPSHEWTIQFEVLDDNRELILGYIDPYAELLRICDRRERNMKYSGLCSPLKLWKPIWLDLQGYDQTIFLRLEKAMQWEHRHLGLGAVVGDELSELFRDLSFSRKKSALISPSRFSQTLKVLRRLGRKMVDHGLLIESCSTDYFTLPADSQRPMLSWQLAPHYLTDLSSGEYENAVAAEYDRSRPWERLVEVLSASAQSKAMFSELKALIEIWQLGAESDLRMARVYMDDGPNLISLRPLFVELLVRCDKSHPLSLYLPLSEGPYASILLKSGQSIVEKFTEFCDQIQSQGNQQREIQNLFQLSLTNPKVQTQPQALEHLVARKLQAPVKSYKTEGSGRQNQKTPGTSKASQSPNKKSQGPQAHQPSMIQLKQEATEVLTRMRKYDRPGYDKLKDAYLHTLDIEKKKIISEVRQRLQPEIFDDHLKQSLIKFMIEHPKYWRTGSYG